MTREEAIQILSTRDWSGMLCGYTSGYSEALDMAIGALQTDVVRCKDCRFWKNEHLCLVMSRYGSIDTKAEHYCSWGERKGGDSE